MMKKKTAVCLALIFAAISLPIWADQAATVTLVFNIVEHGKSVEGTNPASKGTSIQNGEYLTTKAASRAELQLPSGSITRLGANTSFNYLVDSNTVDLQAGTILFSKPKEGAPRLNIKTAAVTAGIVGTTGFVSVDGKTTVLGLIEGHAIANADSHPFLLGPGDALQFRAGAKPFLFSFDTPRLVKSSPLLSKSRYPSTLPTQSYIDKALADYADDVSRGFITPPSNSISYSGGIPILSGSLSSAQNAQSQAKGTAPTPPPAPTSTYPRGSNPYNGNSPYH
jgi:hypothetical protein